MSLLNRSNSAIAGILFPLFIFTFLFNGCCPELEECREQLANCEESIETLKRNLVTIAMDMQSKARGWEDRANLLEQENKWCAALQAWRAAAEMRQAAAEIKIESDGFDNETLVNEFESESAAWNRAAFAVMKCFESQELFDEFSQNAARAAERSDEYRSH